MSTASKVSTFQEVPLHLLLLLAASTSMGSAWSRLSWEQWCCTGSGHNRLADSPWAGQSFSLSPWGRAGGIPAGCICAASGRNVLTFYTSIRVSLTGDKQPLAELQVAKLLGSVGVWLVLKHLSHSCLVRTSFIPA